jgi:hypothetical protein
VEEAARKLEAELLGARQQVAALEAALRGRDKDVDALQRLVEQAKVIGVCFCLPLHPV